MNMRMVHDRGFMGDTIKLEHCLQQEKFLKRCFAIFAKKKIENLKWPSFFAKIL